MGMTRQDIEDLLLGKAVKYLTSKNIEYHFWRLVEKVNYIVDNNIQYESYNIGNMQDELYKYCEELDK